MLTQIGKCIVCLVISAIGLTAVAILSEPSPENDSTSESIMRHINEAKDLSVNDFFTFTDDGDILESTSGYWFSVSKRFEDKNGVKIYVVRYKYPETYGNTREIKYCVKYDKIDEIHSNYN